MRDTLTISALAKRSGVPSKTIRYWEGLGLLPQAARTHSGYRVFEPDALRYVGFIRKSKAIGLTLAEMQEILRLARAGRCPCPEVIEWTAARAQAVEAEIRELSKLLRRLKRIRREWSRKSCTPTNCGQICSLVEELPESQTYEGGKNAKNLECCGRPVLSRLPARMSLLPGRLRQPRTANHN